MKKLIVKPSLFLKSDEEKAKIEKIKEAWKEDNFIVIPSEFSYEVIDVEENDIIYYAGGVEFLRESEG